MEKRTEKELIITHQEINTLDNGLKGKKMAMGCYNIRMGQSMTGSGSTISPKIKAKLSMQIKTNIKEHF